VWNLQLLNNPEQGRDRSAKPSHSKAMGEPIKRRNILQEERAPLVTELLEIIEPFAERMQHQEEEIARPKDDRLA
jgi:hypothetical protein